MLMSQAKFLRESRKKSKKRLKTQRKVGWLDFVFDKEDLMFIDKTTIGNLVDSFLDNLPADSRGNFKFFNNIYLDRQLSRLANHYHKTTYSDEKPIDVLRKLRYVAKEFIEKRGWIKARVSDEHGYLLAIK